MRRQGFLILRIFLTIFIVGTWVYIGNLLEYFRSFQAFDNLTGAMPFILLCKAAGFLIALTWTLHKRISTVAIVFALMAIFCIVLFIPGMTGNWHITLRTSASQQSGTPDSQFENMKTAELPERASIIIEETFPILDGATALYPLYTSFANATYEGAGDVSEVAICTNTPNAYESIIAGEVDIIFVAGPSENQRKQMIEAGVELVYTPIGREAFVFLVGKTNPIEDITYQQLKNIYSGKTANWKSLGWEAGGRMIVFQRPDGSGSQTGLQNLMGNLPIQRPQPLPDNRLSGNGSMMEQVSVKWQGVQPAIGYSYRYYAVSMFANEDAKLLSINGIYPSLDSIADGTYPFADNFYAVTNGEPEGNVKQLIDWILSEEGQYLVEKVGYVPLGK